MANFSDLDTGNSIDVSSGTIQVTSILNTDKILQDFSVQSDPNFDDETKWKAVIVTYNHANGQSKSFTHKKVGTSWVAEEGFSEFSNAGTWEKTSFVFVDKMNDRHVVSRDQFGSGEDLTIMN